MPAPVDLDSPLSSSELRMLVAQAQDRAYARRLHAIVLIVEGHSRLEVAMRVGIGAAALRQWVHRFNTGGPEALKHAPSSGRPAKLSLGQRVELARMIKSSLNEREWRLSDIADAITERFNVCYDQASVGRLMKSLGFCYVGGQWRARLHHERAGSHGPTLSMQHDAMCAPD